MARWGNTDFSQLKQLQERINQFESFDKDAFCREAAQELAARLYALVVKNTKPGEIPDYISEKAKEQWAGYQGGTLKKAWTIGSIEKMGNEYVVEISNPMQYAEYWEYGHRATPGRFVPKLGLRLKTSWVEGHFVMTTAEAKIRSIAPAVIEQALYRKLLEVFN